MHTQSRQRGLALEEGVDEGVLGFLDGGSELRGLGVGGGELLAERLGVGRERRERELHLAQDRLVAAVHAALFRDVHALRRLCDTRRRLHLFLRLWRGVCGGRARGLGRGEAHLRQQLLHDLLLCVALHDVVQLRVQSEVLFPSLRSVSELRKTLEERLLSQQG